MWLGTVVRRGKQMRRSPVCHPQPLLTGCSAGGCIGCFSQDGASSPWPPMAPLSSPNHWCWGPVPPECPWPFTWDHQILIPSLLRPLRAVESWSGVGAAPPFSRHMILRAQLTSCLQKFLDPNWATVSMIKHICKWQRTRAELSPELSSNSTLTVAQAPSSEDPLLICP